MIALTNPKSRLSIILPLLLALMSPVRFAAAGTPEEAITMDLVVTYDETTDSATIKWFPAFPDSANAFEIRCYDQSGKAVTYVASSSERFYRLDQIERSGLREIEVCSLDANNTSVEITPREQLGRQSAKLAMSESGGEVGTSSPGQLDISLVSCDSRNFPFIYLTVRVNENGQPVDNLTKANFSVTEDGRVQTDFFEVTPPQTGGGVRMADIVFLIDTSGSMGDEISGVRNNCVAFANALAASDIDYRLGLVRFGQSANNGNPSIIGGGLTDNAEIFKGWVSTLIAGGGTEPGFWAIRLAIQSFSFRPGSQKVFILITDEDADEPRDKANTLNLILANDVTVHSAVDCSYSSSNSDYCDSTSVRGVSGGLLFPVLGNYTDILDTIQGYVANTYIVRYRTDNSVMDGREREVVCIVTKDTSSDSITCTYTPGGAPVIQRTQATIDLYNQPLVAGSSPTIAVKVTDSTAPFVQSVTLYVRVTGSVSEYISINMSNQGGNIYAAQAPTGNVQTPGLDYYIRATDGQVTSSDPSTDPETKPYQIAVLPNEAPVIEHTPPAWWVSGRDCELTVRAQDTTHHIKSIWIYYRTKGELLYNGVGRTYVAGTTDVTDTFPCYGSKFVQPAAEYYIEVTDDLGIKRVWPAGGADKPHELAVREPLRGSVYVTTGWWIFSERHPLPYIQVSLMQTNGSYNQKVIADENGNFEFAPKSVTELIPAGDYKLSCILWYKPEWASGDGWVFRIMHDTSDVLVASRNSFNLDFGNSSPARRDIDFSDTGNYEPLITEPTRIIDLATTYHYTAEFWQFVHSNLATHIPALDLPLEIHAFSTTGDCGPVSGAYYCPDGNEVWINPNQYPSDNRPMNCEWHECSHYLMHDAHGHLGVRHTGDGNHRGFNNHCTGDSWSEGWAEYWPCALRFIRGDNDWFVYAGFGSLEVNYNAWDNEEFAVAGILLDLIDNDQHDNNENGTDRVQLSVADIWNLIGLNSNLYDFKNVYDSLVAANIGQNDGDNDGITDLDEIFVSHGFFADRQTIGQAGYRVWNVGEEIGRAADAARPNRRNTPKVPNAYILLGATTPDGYPTKQSLVKIEMEYESPWEGYNYTMNQPIDSLSKAHIYIHPGAEQFNTIIKVHVEDPNGNQSDALELSMKEYRQIVERSEGPYVIAHEFEIGAVGETVVVKDIFVDPIGSDQTWFSAYIELEPNEQPQDIDLAEVQLAYAKGKKLNSAIAAASDPCLPFVQQRITTDRDNDGIQELAVKFPRDIVFAALIPMEEKMSVTIRWIDSFGIAHEGTVFVSGFQSVDELVSVSVGQIGYDRKIGEFGLNVTVPDMSGMTIGSPLWLVIESISATSVTVADSDGITADGKPYIDLSELLGDGQLEPGESVTKRIYFNNPDGVRFTFEPSVRGVILGTSESSGLSDLARLSGHWLGSEPSLDVAPAGGDGIVNLRDFAVLAEKWLEGK